MSKRCFGDSRLLGPDIVAGRWKVCWDCDALPNSDADDLAVPVSRRQRFHIQVSAPQPQWRQSKLPLKHSVRESSLLIRQADSPKSPAREMSLLCCVTRMSQDCARLEAVRAGEARKLVCPT